MTMEQPVLMREQSTFAVRICLTCPAEIFDDKPVYVKQCPDCYNDPTTKRNCEICCLPKITVTEPAWKKVCGACYKASDFRKCICCSQASISNTEPTWRTLCLTCFKDPSLYRKCGKCGQNTIKPGSADFLKQCGACWLKDKAKTHISCPECKDPRLRVKKGQSMCRDCMRGKGIIKTK